MSGDFTAYLLHQNPDFYPVENPKDANNRYLFPSFTEEVFGWIGKISLGNALQSEHIDCLIEHYHGKKLVLPTHRFQPTFDDRVTFVRLYTHDILTARLNYALWFLKAHSILSNFVLTKERMQMLQNIYPKQQREHILKYFHWWKYFAWKYEFVHEDGFDSLHYVKNFFIKYYYQWNHRDCNYKRNYQYVDIKELIYNRSIDSLCGVELNKTLISEYAQSNKLLLEKNGIDIHSDQFFEQLHSAVQSAMNQTMELKL